jgi:hypothetical protein
MSAKADSDPVAARVLARFSGHEFLALGFIPRLLGEGFCELSNSYPIRGAKGIQSAQQPLIAEHSLHGLVRQYR